MKYLPILLLPLLCLTGHAAPQFYRPMPGQAMIVVQDSTSGDPLIGATVTLASPPDTLRGVAAKRNWGYRVAAVYECDKMFRDSVDVTVSYLGYKPFNKKYAPNDFRGYMRVQMIPDEQSIAQIVVTGRQVAMVFRGDTIVYNADAFKTLADDRLGDLLGQLPGVEIKDDKIFANGEEVKRVYVDGRNLFGADASAPLADMKASDVKNVEVYEQESTQARHTGDKSAKKETVMNVETKSKRKVVVGGDLALVGGLSLEKDYSDRREARHSEAGNFYRHNEGGSIRIAARHAKDEPNRSGRDERMQSKITPSKQTDASVRYEFRRGDTTVVRSSLSFSRTRSGSESFSSKDYFPTADYALRLEENRSDRLAESLSGNVDLGTVIMRRKHTFYLTGSLSLDEGRSSGDTRTLQRIDERQTSTQLHSDDDTQGLSTRASAGYTFTLSEKSWLYLSAEYAFDKRRNDGWQIDTLASTPGLRMLLDDAGRSRSHTGEVQAGFRRKTGENSYFSAAYSFSKERTTSRRLAVDFLDDPRGRLDTVNSFDYASASRTHSVELSWNYNSEELNVWSSLTGSAIRLVRDERFPEENHLPRHFLQLRPMLFLQAGKPRNRFMAIIQSNPRTVSPELLRTTLDATDPLALTAGNPDLKMSNDLSGMFAYEHTDAESSRSWSLGLSGGYTFNYIATRRTLFLENTWLEPYNYTAQAGAQLTTQVNVGGCYELGASVEYEQQIAPIRTTFRASASYRLRQTPYYLDETLSHSVSHGLTVDAGVRTGFSTKIRIDLSTSTALSSYTTQQSTARDLRETVRARIELRPGRYFASVGLFYQFYCNDRSKELTRHDVILNLAAGRKFGRDDRFSVSVGAVDILNRPDHTRTSFDTDYILTSTTSYLGRYAYLRAAFTF